MVCFECWKFWDGSSCFWGNWFQSLCPQESTEPSEVVHPVCKGVVSWWFTTVRSQKLWNTLVPLGAVAWHGWDAAEPHIHRQPAPCCVTQRDAHAHRVSVLLGKAKYGAAVAAAATWNLSATESTCCSEQLPKGWFGDTYAGTWITNVSLEFLESSQWVSGRAEG